MVIYNKCQYETTKDKVSNLVSRINKFHSTGELTPTILGNRVRFSVVSNASKDFFDILPYYNFSHNNYKLTKLELSIKELIELLLFRRLTLKDTESHLEQEFSQVSYSSILRIVSSLKFCVKMYPIPSENMVYLGIGSRRLGHYIMNLYTDKISDGIYPKFDLDDGFIDPMLDNSINNSNSSNSTKSVCQELNNKFMKWKADDSSHDILSKYNIDDLI